MLVTSVAGGDVARVGAVFSMPVCVIREGLPAMLADYLLAIVAKCWDKVDGIAQTTL